MHITSPTQSLTLSEGRDETPTKGDEAAASIEYLASYMCRFYFWAFHIKGWFLVDNLDFQGRKKYAAFFLNDHELIDEGRFDLDQDDNVTIRTGNRRMFS